MVVKKLSMLPDRVRRARLHHRLRAGRTTSAPARCAGSPCRTGLRRVRPAARAHLHPGHQGGRGPRREHRLRARRRTGRRPRADRARPRRSRSRSTSTPPSTPARAGSSWPTPSSSSASTPTARSRSAMRCARRTPRASGPPTSTSPAARSRASTSSSCATGPPRPAGTATRRRPAIPDEVVARTREKYIEAYERVTGAPYAGWVERTGLQRTSD